MRQLAQSTIIAAAALAGLAFGGIAVSQVTQPEKKAPEKVDSPSKDDPAAAATGLPTQYRLQSQDQIRSLQGPTYQGFKAPEGMAVEVMKQVPDDPKDPDIIKNPPPASCPMVTVEGKAPLRAGAEFNAKYNWKKESGGPNDDWDLAKGKSMNCRHEGPLRRWSCVASACRGAGPPKAQCKAQLSATGGWAKLQSLAEAKARDQWQHDSGNAHGADYKWWNKARNHDIHCRHDGRKPILRQWQCVARADPCV